MKLDECFRVLGLHRVEVNTFTDVKELKRAYRSQAKKHHPDKNNSNADMFKKINKAYLLLKGVLLARENDKSFSQLKSGKSVQQEISNSIPETFINKKKGKMDMSKFNTMFDEFHVREKGYSDKDFKNANRGVVIPELGGKSTGDQFHRAFRKVKLEQSKHTGQHDQVQKYRPKKTFGSTEGNVHVLGKKTKEFTKTSGKGLRYTDYLKAHTVYNAPSPVVHKESTYSQTVNIDRIKNTRDHVMRQPATMEEIRANHKYKKEIEQENQWRHERWRNEMERVQLQHDSLRHRLGFR